MKCDKCGRLGEDMPWYHLAYRADTHHFCSRRCLIEHLAPELKQAVVIEQWVPTTQEEIDRMSQ